MSLTTQPIGVFDSGSGGLTVLRVLQEKFPHENFVYYADTLNLPYGTKTPAEIIAYTRIACSWLYTVARVKLIVVACHTSSALALDLIEGEFSIPIIGTIYPLLTLLSNQTVYTKIGIIATPASAHSQMHATILKSHGFTGTIRSIACADLVPLIEAPEHDLHRISTAARLYLEPFYTEKLDTLIYGCTHYPLIANIITSLLPSTIQYIDPAYPIAQSIHQILTQKRIATDATQSGKTSYYCTSSTTVFADKINSIMGIMVHVSPVNQITEPPLIP